MSNLTKWGSYDAEAARAEREEVQAEGDFMSLKPGKNVVRFLPPMPGKRSPFKVVHQHFIRIPGNPVPVVFVCPRMMEGSKCPACEMVAKLRATGNKADRDKSFEFAPKRRVFAAVINRAAPDRGPKVLGFGKHIHEELLALRDDEDTGGDYTHPTKGFDIIITRAGEGMKTEYRVQMARHPSPISEDAAQMDAWADLMPDLEQFGRVPPLEEILEKLGIDPEEAQADQRRKAEAGQARRLRRTATKAAAEDAEDAEVVSDDIPY
jgi:hypothetical protein